MSDKPQYTLFDLNGSHVATVSVDTHAPGAIEFDGKTYVLQLGRYVEQRPSVQGTRVEE